MKKITGSMFAALLLMTAAAPAAAQNRELDAEFDFEDELVNGDLVRPDGINIVVREGAGRTSLIQPRGHYVPELLKSIETL